MFYKRLFFANTVFTGAIFTVVSFLTWVFLVISHILYVYNSKNLRLCTIIVPVE